MTTLENAKMPSLKDKIIAEEKARLAKLEVKVEKVKKAKKKNDK